MLELEGRGGLSLESRVDVSHTGDLRLSLILLQAAFIHVGEDAGTSFSEHWEVSAHRWRGLIRGEGAAKGPADGTGHVAVHRYDLRAQTETRVLVKRPRLRSQSVVSHRVPGFPRCLTPDRSLQEHDLLCGQVPVAAKKHR